MEGGGLTQSEMSFPLEGLKSLSTYVFGVAGVLVGRFAFGLGWSAACLLFLPCRGIAAGNVPHEPGLTAHMAEKTEGFSGADLCGVMARMRQIAFDRRLPQYTHVLADEILSLAFPTTSDELVRRIREWEAV